MVFRGKPSKGCLNCRARKKKCGQQVPACSRCISSGHACLGYRDTLDLSFLDESENVIRKAQRESTHGPRAASYKQTLRSGTLVKHRNSMSTSGNLLEGSSKIYRALSATIEDEATSYFLHNYVLPESTFSNGSLSTLRSLAVKPSTGEGLANAIAALGMVGLSVRNQAPELLKQAESKYRLASSQTCTALCDPSQLRGEWAPSALVLLGLFETMTSQKPERMTSLTVQTQMATNMLKVRGVEQFDKQAGVRLFAVLRRTIVLNCLHSVQPVPSHITEWSQISKYMESETDRPTNEIMDILTRFVAFRVALKNSSFADFAEIASTLLGIEADLLEWPDRLPAEWKYTTKPKTSESSDIWGNVYIVYNDLNQAFVWNLYRCTHILVCSSIAQGMTNTAATSFPDVPPTYFSVYKSFTGTVYKLCLEIAASVWFHMHNASKQPVLATGPAAGGYFILWGLFVIGSSEKVRPVPKEWAVARLQDIGYKMGIPHALALADLLRETDDVPHVHEAVWDRIGALQAYSHMNH